MSFWTEERVNRLVADFYAGKSARQTAERLGVSRNKIIGKRHRMGLKAKDMDQLQIEADEQARIEAAQKAEREHVEKQIRKRPKSGTMCITDGCNNNRVNKAHGLCSVCDRKRLSKTRPVNKGQVGDLSVGGASSIA